MKILIVTMYADDTTLSFEGKNLSQAMQIIYPEHEKISLWIYRNQLTQNVLKTHYMVFHKPKIFLPSTLQSLFIGLRQIERVFDIRSLGVNLDPCLNFKKSIHDVVKKCLNFFPLFTR